MTEHPHTDIEPSCGVPDSASNAVSGLPVSTQGGSLFKTCTACLQEKSFGEFSNGRAQCKKCRSEKSRVYRKTFPEKVNATNRAWRCRNYEVALALDLKYRKRYQANKVALHKKWRLKNRAKYSASQRKYNLANPDKLRAKCQKRRAALVGAPGFAYTKPHHIAERWAMWGGKCWICGALAEATDHVIPLKAGYRDKPGAHWPSNLRPICRSCNSAKHNKQPDFSKRQAL